MHGMAAAGQFDGDRGRERGLADSALAHEHDESMTVRRQVRHEVVETGGELSAP